MPDSPEFDTLEPIAQQQNSSPDFDSLEPIQEEKDQKTKVTREQLESDPRYAQQKPDILTRAASAAYWPVYSVANIPRAIGQAAAGVLNLPFRVGQAVGAIPTKPIPVFGASGDPSKGIPEGYVAPPEAPFGAQKPVVQIPFTPTAMQPEVPEGIQAANKVLGMATPEVLAVTAGTMGAGAPEAAAGYFAPQMVANLPESLDQRRKAIMAPGATFRQKLEEAGGGLVDIGMAAALTTAAGHTTPATDVPEIPKPEPQKGVKAQLLERIQESVATPTAEVKMSKAESDELAALSKKDLTDDGLTKDEEQRYRELSVKQSKAKRSSKTSKLVSQLNEAGVVVPNDFLHPSDGTENHITDWTRDKNGNMQIRVETHTASSMSPKMITVKAGDVLTDGMDDSKVGTTRYREANPDSALRAGEKPQTPPGANPGTSKLSPAVRQSTPQNLGGKDSTPQTTMQAPRSREAVLGNARKILPFGENANVASTPDLQSTDVMAALGHANIPVAEALKIFNGEKSFPTREQFEKGVDSKYWNDASDLISQTWNHLRTLGLTKEQFGKLMPQADQFKSGKDYYDASKAIADKASKAGAGEMAALIKSQPSPAAPEAKPAPAREGEKGSLALKQEDAAVPEKSSVQTFVEDFNQGKIRTTQASLEAGLKARNISDLDALAKARKDVESSHKQFLKDVEAEPDKAKQNSMMMERFQKAPFGQFPREAIEAATNTGSHIEGEGTIPEKLGDRPLDWKTHPEVADWLRKNGESLGIKLPDELASPAELQKRIADLQTQRADAVNKAVSPQAKLDAAKPFTEKISALQAQLKPAKQTTLDRRLSETQSRIKELESKLKSAPASPTGTEPAMEGVGGARAGEIPKEPSRLSEVKSIFGEPLKKARNTIVQLAKSGKVRDTMAYTRDAGDNAANNFAKQQANEPRNSIRRLFPKPADQKIAGDALSFVVESKGNPDALTEMRQKVMDSKNVSPKWKKKAFDAIDFAIYNYDKLKPVAERYSEITGQQVADENAAGIDTLKRNGYVMHAQDIDDLNAGFLSEGVGGEASAFKKVRTHDTFADSIAAGVDPKSLNAFDLLESRLAHGQKMINSRQWIQGLSDMVDPTTGKSIATSPKTVTRADGSTYQQAPEGYTLEHAGFQPVAIHKGYEGIFGALTDPSWFQKNAGARNFMKANAVGKSINLMIDTFHLGRLAFWESLIKGLGVETFKTPRPSYGKGLTLIDNTPAEIRTMAKNGEIPASWMPEMLENKRRLDLAVKTGYNIGRITDNLHSEWIRDIPVAGTVNKFIFDKFQRGAMSEIWLLEFERIKKALPDLPEGEAARRVSKDLNTRFGNLGRQGIFKSRTAQDAAKLLALAPQWNEGLIRSELGAVKQAGELAVDAAKGRQIYSGVLLRSVGAMALGQFAANQLINLYTRGKPTWENPEEGIGAKLSAWIPDKVGKGPGFFLHPLGLAAETTHLIMQKYEKTGDFRKTLNQYIRTRSSAAMRPIMTFITNQDALGRNLKPGSVWGEIVKSAIPTPIGGSAVTQAAKQIVSGEPSESFPGQFQKQAMASGGIKTDQAPSARQRIQSLASEFKKSKGITPSGEFYTGDYQPLSQAAEIGNKKDAKEAVADLLKKKTSAEIQKHYQSAWKYPFTGSKKREAEFFKSLSPEQQDTYKKAIEERKQSAMQAMQAMRDYFATKSQQ